MYKETVYNFHNGQPSVECVAHHDWLYEAGWRRERIVCQMILDDVLSVSTLWCSPDSYDAVCESNDTQTTPASLELQSNQ